MEACLGCLLVCTTKLGAALHVASGGGEPAARRRVRTVDGGVAGNWQLAAGLWVGVTFGFCLFLRRDGVDHSRFACGDDWDST
ncbi:hypothetical protein IWZ00DRAFT_499172 [Phyllosticta capitalensis]|uniref:Uncharacterized protein n=1 Tax=Phyllosticta capitalensis TaxID=121624 RepID=A0ABR1Z047_9PEZI